jgi:APA family basic amino acid/polyamine antiporter
MGGELKRRIGLFGPTAYGVGMILGAGIYALVGAAAGVTGNSLWVSFLLGAFICSFTGLSYAELSSTIPKSAAEYSYAREAFGGDLAPFLVGWIIIFTETVSVATVALGFAGYMKGLFEAAPIVLVSLILITVLSALNFVGIEESSRLNMIFTIIEASGLLLIIALGIPYLGRVKYLEAADRSIIADWQDLGSSCCPLAFVASKAMGESASLVMSVIALFATSNTVLILLIVTSRMIFGMSRDGSLPHSLARISGRGTPWVAVLVSLILSGIFVLFGNIEFVAEVTNFGTFVTFASVNLSTIWLRIRRPNWERPFKIPVSIGKVPLIPLIGLLSSGLMVTQFRLDVIALSALAIILGVVTQRILAKKKRST